MHYKENAAIRERLKAVEEGHKNTERILGEFRTFLKELQEVTRGNADKTARLETKMELFWNAMSDFAADALHKPHKDNARLDMLLDKWKDRSITITELEELRDALCQKVQSKISVKKNGEVYWATLLIARISTMLSDAKSLC